MRAGRVFPCLAIGTISAHQIPLRARFCEANNLMFQCPDKAWKAMCNSLRIAWPSRRVRAGEPCEGKPGCGNPAPQRKPLSVQFLILNSSPNWIRKCLGVSEGLGRPGLVPKVTENYPSVGERPNPRANSANDSVTQLFRV